MEIGEYNIKFDVNIVLWMKVEKLIRIELYTNNELWKLFNIGFFFGLLFKSLFAKMDK